MVPIQFYIFCQSLVFFLLLIMILVSGISWKNASSPQLNYLQCFRIRMGSLILVLPLNDKHRTAGAQRWWFFFEGYRWPHIRWNNSDQFISSDHLRGPLCQCGEDKETILGPVAENVCSFYIKCSGWLCIPLCSICWFFVELQGCVQRGVKISFKPMNIPKSVWYIRGCTNAYRCLKWT